MKEEMVPSTAGLHLIRFQNFQHGEGNPKSEIRNPKESRSPKSAIRSEHALQWKAARCGFGFRISDFLRISDFGFRICPPPLPSFLTLLLTTALSATASAATNAVPVAPGVPEVTFSLLRIFGALLLVLAMFFGGVWLFRNWQRVARPGGRPAKLQVLEMRSLGNRSALFVVGYEQQRLLLASSPTGITLLDCLPAATAAEAEAVAAPVSFAETLRKLLPTR